MLEVKIFGGLGNQMFQYVFYEYLKLNNDDVMMNIYDFENIKHHQGFELEKIFGISCDYNKKKSELAANTYLLPIRILQKIVKAQIVKQTEYYEHKEISYVPQITVKSDLYMVGYWQDIRYLRPVEDKIKKTFQFPELDEQNEKFFWNLRNQETVAVHIRRGDYIGNPGLGNVCDIAYYDKAIMLIKKLVENPVFVFFSDDIDWCKSTFKGLNAKYVDWNKQDNSFRDMQLMSLCKHNIIANSTFSWWGAYLNSNDKKQVISPSVWNVRYGLNRLADQGWILI